MVRSVQIDRSRSDPSKTAPLGLSGNRSTHPSPSVESLGARNCTCHDLILTSPQRTSAGAGALKLAVTWLWCAVGKVDTVHGSHVIGKMRSSATRFSIDVL